MIQRLIYSIPSGSPCNYLDYLAHNFAIDTSVDFTIATTSEPSVKSSSFMDLVVMTEVIVPNGVPTTISDTTGPANISMTLPLN